MQDSWINARTLFVLEKKYEGIAEDAKEEYKRYIDWKASRMILNDLSVDRQNPFSLFHLALAAFFSDGTALENPYHILITPQRKRDSDLMLLTYANINAELYAFEWHERVENYHKGFCFADILLFHFFRNKTTFTNISSRFYKFQPTCPCTGSSHYNGHSLSCKRDSRMNQK